jgi:glutamate formiminotransferase/formiminotetrahydrofolate cyclodeaminase
MVPEKILECVPNISEGTDRTVIEKLCETIESVTFVRILRIDIGKDANRSVITFAGSPDAVIEAAYKMVEKASELIDMRNHKGVHPRIGAVDVLPLIPVKNMIMEEVVLLADELAERIGKELRVPVYCYEHNANNKIRKKLENIRRGEYELLKERLKFREWKPDYGPAVFHPQFGAMVVGARDFLIAYNINLETDNVGIARDIAARVRESGRIYFRHGKPLKTKGLFEGVKAIGWYLPDYKHTQVSLNVTNYKKSPLHEIYAVVSEIAHKYETKVAGSELIGLVPLDCMIQSGKLLQQGANGSDQLELIKQVINQLGLNSIEPFEPYDRIIEFVLDKSFRLV